MQFILAGVLGVIFLGLFIVTKVLGQTNFGSAGMAVFMLLILGILALSGFTYIVFDRNTGTMTKLLLGFIPAKRIPFDQLQGVNIVTQRPGSFNYRVFKKDNQYGRGTLISCGYSKDTDRNAVAFNNEVVPAIHRFLDAVAPLAPAKQAEAITDYQHFTADGSVYTLKIKKIGLLVFGLGFLFIGIHECTPAAWVTETTTIGKLMMCVVPILFGVIFTAAAFTKITFDTSARIVERKSPIMLGNHRFSFNEFSHFQTIRKTYNGIYAGTDVQMYFLEKSSGKAKSMLLTSFRNTRHIDRFVEEVKSIMK
ncbi:hypothetical protein F0L74_26350 [Chitinophaga agrisoli]|uniref:Uncharacterized protein n=1 Tax=Chitinophaga agrisoli TaxID=2607653 RepID=A0A5B2VMS4_9BACT|nr:hypothetical protein [Chitinophaga agrisoli]KAA2239716.1 hypothetical protein F0L74_26350 [Chitinophaga agrisoli]